MTTWQAMIHVITAAALTLFVLLAAPLLFAQSGGPYELSWSTVDGGGATFSSGGGYALGGTIGQPDSGLLTGGAYTLRGGFWSGASAEQYLIYIPLVLRNGP